MDAIELVEFLETCFCQFFDFFYGCCDSYVVIIVFPVNLADLLNGAGDRHCANVIRHLAVRLMLIEVSQQPSRLVRDECFLALHDFKGFQFRRPCDWLFWARGPGQESLP